MQEWIQKYWIGVAFGLVTSGMAYFVKRINKKVDEQESLKLGVQALLRDRIIQSYNHHCERGFCPIYARENLDELAKQYYNLGGNGVVHKLMDLVSSLPTSEPEHKV
jgi:hypothetical protein